MIILIIVIIRIIIINVCCNLYMYILSLILLSTVLCMTLVHIKKKKHFAVIYICLIRLLFKYNKNKYVSCLHFHICFKLLKLKKSNFFYFLV